LIAENSTSAAMSTLPAESKFDPVALGELREYYKTSAAYREHLLLKQESYFERFISHVCACSSAADLILDVGCGTGQSSVRIGQRGRKVIGTDLSGLFLQGQAKAKACSFVSSDASRLPFADQTFGVVCAMEFIEHVWPVECVLREMDRVLKPGGQIVLTSPNLLSPLWPIRDFPRMLSRHQFRPPLYTSFRQALWFLRKSCQLSFGKMLSSTPEFIPRKPDVEHADFGGDFDAVYYSNSRDILLFFQGLGYRVRRGSEVNASLDSFLRNCGERFVGSLWTSFILTATKAS
jgi:ubiquinone/menaquinone biosynthesis C-methylase UbiE